MADGRRRVVERTTSVTCFSSLKSFGSVGGGGGNRSGHTKCRITRRPTSLTIQQSALYISFTFPVLIITRVSHPQRCWEIDRRPWKGGLASSRRPQGWRHKS